MPRNTINDLNDHLFMALERLNEDDLEGDRLQEEVQRAKAVSSIAERIISSGNLMVRAAEFNDVKLDANNRLPRLLGGCA